MSKQSKIPSLRFKGFEGVWEFRKLRDVTSYVDYRGRAPIKTDNGHFLVTAKNIKKGFIDYECSKEYVAEKDYSNVMSKGIPDIGDILFTTEAPMGNVALVDRANIALAQRVIKFRGKEMLSNFYLLHYMLSNIFQNDISQKAIGTTVQGISGKELHQIKISYPSLPEQQKIASFLSAMDEKIQQLSRKKELLEQYKKGVMQQLFSGKLRFKDENGKDYANWEEKKLGDVCESIKSGKSNSSEEGKFPLYGSTGIIGKCIEHSHEGLYILIARVGANAGTINLIKDKFGLSDNTLVLNCNQNSFIDYLFHYLGYFNLNRLVFGSGQPLITGGQLKVLQLNLPSFPEQQKIAKFLSSIDTKIESCSQQINQTQSFKKGLLQQLFV